MKVIKRILGDILGIFTIPLCALFQQRSFAEIIGIFFLGFQIIWFVLKTIWKFLTVWKDFRNPLGKIFVFFSIFSSITAGVLTVFLPDLALATYNFMPISIAPIQRLYTAIIQHVTTSTSIASTCGWFCISLLTVMMMTGASLIPIFAYIWVVLLLGFIWAAIAEFGRGKQNAFLYMLDYWWNWDVQGLLTSILLAVRWWLYFIPIVNVCFYRILLKRDKKSKYYPPLNERGKLDHEKLSHLDNGIYSRIVT